MTLFYTTDEVAIAFRVKASTVRKWIKQGTLAPIRIGHDYLIPAAEFDRLVGNTGLGQNGAKNA